MSDTNRKPDAAKGQGEPVLYQYRTKPDWDERHPWTTWADCTKEGFEQYNRFPHLHNWLHETRALYLSAPASAQPADRDEEILALHRQVAAEKLRADQGWQRAEAKSRECIELRERMAGAKPADDRQHMTLDEMLALCAADPAAASGLPLGAQPAQRGIDAQHAAFKAAVDAEYPVPDNPHASVIQRATDNRAAMWRGINAARKILSPDAAPLAVQAQEGGL